MRILAVLAVVLGAAALPVRAADPPRVVVTLKPLHSLAAALLEGIARPDLLLDGAASPHAQALRPSQRRALQAADVVVWVGPELEGFLVKPLSVLPDRVRLVGLLGETPNLHRLPMADGDGDQGHGHGDHGHEDHGHHGHEIGAYDPHIWLSPENARAIARHLAAVLAPLVDDPRLGANAAALDARLQRLQADLAARLGPVRERPFVVFHPAYTYLVEAFGLHQAGAIALAPEQGSSARHLAELRERIDETGAVCAFREPQFSERAVAGLARDTGLKLAVLDPLGVDVPAGPGAYAAILEGMAASLAACLAK